MLWHGLPAFLDLKGPNEGVFLEISCFLSILAVLESLSAINFSLNSNACSTAECFCNYLVLRFETFPDCWIFFLYLAWGLFCKFKLVWFEIYFLYFRSLWNFGVLKSEPSSGFVSALERDKSEESEEREEGKERDKMEEREEKIRWRKVRACQI